jgi:hypothetical protein
LTAATLYAALDRLRTEGLVGVDREGQRHPSPGELGALVRGGLAMRLLSTLPRAATRQSTRSPTDWAG